MIRAGLICGVALGVLALAGCGQSQEAPSRLDRTLGGVPAGAPLGPASVDPGILQDGTAYQPVKLAPATEEPEPAVSVAVRGADTETQVRLAVSGLVDAIRDGEAAVALRSFSPAHVKPLLEQANVLLSTFEKIDLLRRLLRDKLEAAQVEELLSGFQGGAGQPKWEILDADHATVTPNPATILFGPEKSTPALQLVRQKGEWRFQLGAALSEADAKAVRNYHEKLQKALDQIIDWVDSSASVEVAQLKSVLDQALQGRAVEVGGKKEKTEAATPREANEPKEAPPPVRGRGRGAPRGS